MNQTLFYLFVFFSSNYLIAEEKASNLTIDTGFRYAQGLSIVEKEYTKWGHSFDGSLSLDGQLGENFFGKIEVTHQAERFTCEKTYLKEAFVGGGLPNIFSIKAGCLKQVTFGWDQKNYDLRSTSQSVIRNILYNNKYKKLIELNLHFFGDFTAQALEDSHPEEKKGQIALNFAWQKQIEFFTPLLQFNTFSNFESFAYTLGLKFDWESFLLRLDAGQVRKKNEKDTTHFNVAPSYNFQGFFEAKDFDSLEFNMIGQIDQVEKFNSEYHLIYNMNLNNNILLFSDAGITLEDKNYLLGFNLGFTARL